MAVLSDFIQITPYVWEIPKTKRNDMRVPARIHINAAMLESILNDRSVEQLINVATLPGVHEYALAMPDIHQGYGFPVGGVAAVRTKDGVISPGGIGYDINCGVRLLCSPFYYDELKNHLKDLTQQMGRDVPSGVGKGGQHELSTKELDQVLNEGMRWALRHGLASDADLEATEEDGCYRQADAECVSSEAKQRGSDQLGTIGAGNHFVEIQKISAILSPDRAAKFGLSLGQVCIMIHTGSRGLGHQVCTDYVRLMNKVMGSYGITLPDRELACVPFHSEEGERYLRAMAAAANFAWTNRQLVTSQIRESWQRVLKTSQAQELRLLYDVSHNIAKLEKYGGVECLVHRKGATRAFAPGCPELKGRFQETGQPVIIPGSMGTNSYVLAGTSQAMESTFGSCCHGAGRAMSRMRAKKTLDYQTLLKRLADRGIVVHAGSAKGLLEEAPEAYKDVDAVVEVVAQSGVAEIVAKLTPVAVIKG